MTGLTALTFPQMNLLAVFDFQTFPMTIKHYIKTSNNSWNFAKSTNVIAFVYQKNSLTSKFQNSLTNLWPIRKMPNKNLLCVVEHRKRTCQCGAGQETTKDKGDTPGFPIQSTAIVHCENQKCFKLYMPRNHSRINQMSSLLIQTWRANCDIQILIYESNPDDPDLKEISKVTDYVVAYSCKGNSTWQEEIETNKNMILSMKESTSDNAESYECASRSWTKLLLHAWYQKQKQPSFLLILTYSHALNTSKQSVSQTQENLPSKLLPKRMTFYRLTNKDQHSTRTFLFTTTTISSDNKF